MSRVDKNNQLLRRKARVRKSIHGSDKRPRMTVFISNKNISVQLIDDDKSATIAYSTSIGRSFNGKNMSEIAIEIGKDIAAKALKKKIKTVVFDRNGMLYHGRIKALADSAREAGLEF